MRIFLKSRNGQFYAEGEYDPDSKKLIVKKGSKVSSDIRESPTFRGGAAIAEKRAEYTKDGIVVVDAPFKSPSTAANFVTGRSTNGLITWKDSEGKKLKDIL